MQYLLSIRLRTDTAAKTALYVRRSHPYMKCETIYIVYVLFLQYVNLAPRMAKTTLNMLFIMLIVSFVVLNENKCECETVDGIWAGQVYSFRAGMLLDAIIIVDSKNFLYKIDYSVKGDPHLCGGYWSQTGPTKYQEYLLYGNCAIGDVFFTIQTNGTAVYQMWIDQALARNGSFTHRASLCL